MGLVGRAIAWAAPVLGACFLPFVAPEGLIRAWAGSALSLPISPYADDLAWCPGYSAGQLRLITGYSLAWLLSIAGAAVIIAIYVRNARRGLAEGAYDYGGPQFRWVVRGLLASLLGCVFVFAGPSHGMSWQVRSCADEYLGDLDFMRTVLGYGVLLALARLAVAGVKRF